MKLLALDTTGWTCSVALWEDGVERSFIEETTDRDQAALLPSLVKDIVGKDAIDDIIVGIGPGSFTGIRVGLAFARGLAMGWAIPLKGIDSFTSVYTCLESQRDVLVLIEAHRQDVFGRLFSQDVAYPPQTLTRDMLEDLLAQPTPPLLAGNGVYPFADGLTFDVISSPWRGAQSLAYTFFKKKNALTDPYPYYVREADTTSPRLT